jgi:lysophospholipase L1-like esterase
MAGYDGRGAKFPLTIVEGADMAIELTVTSGGSPVNLSAATIAGEVYGASGSVIDTMTSVVSGAGSNVVTLSFTDTETSALTGARRWTLWVTRGGDKRPWLAGQVNVTDGTTGQSGTSGSYTLTVDGDLSVAVNVAAIGPDYDLLDARYAPLLRYTKARAIPIMASAPTIATPTTSTGIASARSFTTSVYTGGEPNLSFFSTPVGGPWTIAGDSYPNYLFVRAPISTTAGGTTTQTVEFIVDADVFEFIYKGIAGRWRMWVDGELISTAGVGIPNDGNIYYQKFTFGSVASRKITLELYNASFGGVVVGPNGSVSNCESARPKCLLIGDSFAEGTGGNIIDSFVQQLAAHLDWDVWGCGQGGSGYSAPGSYTGKYSTRLSAYAATNFDVVIVSGGINDMNVTYAASVAADAASLFSTIDSTWPNARKIVVSPMVAGGVQEWSSYYYTVMVAVRTATAAAGFQYIDLMEMNVNGTAVAGTVAASTIAGATTITSETLYPIGTTMEISTGTANRERRVVENVTGVGPSTYTVAALTYTHSSGDVFKQVGPSFWTGTGRVGAPTGTGNCDLYVSTDNVHPSVAGHAAIGRTVAELVAAVVGV